MTVRPAPPIQRPSAVLFACTHNAVRSPMAEGLMRHFHGSRVFVCSVGAHRGELDLFAVAVMGEIGIDISGHGTRSFADIDLENARFDVVVSLSPEAQHHAVELTRNHACQLEFWNIFDPTAVEGSRDARLDAYRMVRDQMRRRILERFPLASADA